MSGNSRVAIGMSLHGAGGGRKYLNSVERQRFLRALHELRAKERLFCLTLMFAGGRISEVLALTAAAIDLESCVAAIETLKRRRKGVVRQIPLPSWLIEELKNEFDIPHRQQEPTLANKRLWKWSRTTAWRHVKAAMAKAGIHGLAATPKGLRHTFGVASFQALVPPHLVQRWLGHASLRTTAIYADVMGREERRFAARLWRDWGRTR